MLENADGRMLMVEYLEQTRTVICLKQRELWIEWIETNLRLGIHLQSTQRTLEVDDDDRTQTRADGEVQYHGTWYDEADLMSCCDLGKATYESSNEIFERKPEFCSSFEVAWCLVECLES